MRWWVHWGMQYFLATIPGGSAVHRFVQERAGQLRHLERGNQFQNALNIIELAESSGCGLDEKRVIEIGTGWVPAIPVALSLCGAEVHTFDVSALSKRDYFQRTLAAWQPRLSEIAQAARQPLERITKRWNRLAQADTLDDFCQMTGGRALAPCDTTQLPDATGSFDLSVSNLVLQCVPEELVMPVLRESVRLLKPGGWSIHRIRMTDEYAKGDPQRHELHFLTYSRQTWNRWFNHRLKCQNRWRASQFLTAFHDVGLQPHVVRRHRDPNSVKYFQHVSVTADLSIADEDDLATLGMDVAYTKPLHQSDTTC